MLFQIMNVNFVPCSWHVDYIISHNNMYYTKVIMNGGGGKVTELQSGQVDIYQLH